MFWYIFPYSYREVSIHIIISFIAGLFGGMMVPAMQLGDDTLHEMQDLDSDKVSSIWDISLFYIVSLDDQLFFMNTISISMA